MDTIIVIGGGLMGAAIAWRLAERGESVTVIEGPGPISGPGATAAWASAGMLAPVTETTFTETTLLELNLASLERWPAFAEQLRAAGGDPGYRTASTISVAQSPDDAARLHDFADFCDAQNLPIQPLTSREVRAREPLLSPKVRSGLLVDADVSIDNRMLWRALVTAATAAGARFIPGSVTAVTTDDARATGVRTDDGSTLPARHIVLAAGAWSGSIDLPVTVPVRPVKGQILRLDAGRLPQLSHTVRAFSHGAEVYLVPRTHGEVVVGATVEEQGFDTRVTADGAWSLLRDARQVFPLSAEYTVAEFSVGFRPGSSDNAPFLGASGVDGLTLACGHHRNGVLLVPLTADIISTWICDGTVNDLARKFTLARLKEDA